MRDPVEVATAFDRACGAAGVDYALIGGMAVIAWGQPRTTMDVDTLLDLDTSRIHELVDALQREDLHASAADFHDSLQDASHISAHDGQSIFRVDIKLARTDAERHQIQHGVRVDLPSGGTVRVARAEDTIAWKLRFGSPQDLQDARSIWWRQGDRLDLPALRSLCRELGVSDALADLESLDESE